MSLVPSLLRAIIDVDGEALVMHAGERPYVVAPTGQVELAKQLTPDAVKGIVTQLLPVDASRTLEETGAVQHVIVSPPEFSGETFVVVAAYGGDDAWVEIRRRKIDEQDLAPEEVFAPAARRLAIAATVQRVTEAANLRRPTAPVPHGEADSSARVEFAPPPLPPAANAGAPRRTPQFEPSDRELMPPAAVVLPLTRGPGRPDGVASAAERASPLDRLLQLAAARGASVLYISSYAQPSVRVDGELQTLEHEPSLAPDDVESMLLLVESVREVAGVGRVRGTTFRDQRGPGGVFRLMPAHGASIERLELSPEALSLALEPRGLVLIVGPRRSGKRSTISALVGHMNRTRRDHVITIERDVTVAHERGTSIVSQREVSGTSDDVEAAVRLALREDPDVLVIDSIRTASLVRLALDAAAAGRLVIAGLAAQDTASAVGHVIDLHPAETRGPLQLALARNLRGIVAQVLLRRADGGQVAAREVVLNTPAVASVIAEGLLSQLPMAIDAARTVGMPRLNDALASLVQKGTVDVREAYRKAVDPAGLLAKLKRLGLDTTAISP